MALLKAFVCQVVLFGLYKLFLEQVVEDHLVPDELTRNCLVGSVILLCFGIQLYTDKAEDDLAEIEEDPKTKSKSSESTSAEKFESPEITVTNKTVTKTVGSEPQSRVMNEKIQTAPLEVSKEEKQNSMIQQVVDLQEGNSTLPSTEAEEVTKKSHAGIFAEFSTNVPDKIGSAVKTSCELETKTFQILNGLSEINVSQESDEEGIEIDQFVCKESSKAAEQLMAVDEVRTTKRERATEALVESQNLISNAVNITSTKYLNSDPMIDKSEQLITVKTEEVQTTKPENVTETVMESESLISNGMKNSTTQDLNPDPIIVESRPLMKVEVETTRQEYLTEAVVESECLTSNGVNISSKPDLDSNSTVNESESQLINGAVMEVLNIIDEKPLNITKESEINSKKDGKETRDGREITSTFASDPDIRPKDITESLLSAQDTDSTSTVSTKTVNKGQTVNKNNIKTSTAVNTTIPSTRRKISASESVCVTYFPVDISFIYACH